MEIALETNICALFIDGIEGPRTVALSRMVVKMNLRSLLFLYIIPLDV